ncbi:hypothetical protein ACA910_005936 [Epithemia clementina (nom. ined.)]
MGIRQRSSSKGLQTAPPTTVADRLSLSSSSSHESYTAASPDEEPTKTTTTKKPNSPQWATAWYLLFHVRQRGGMTTTMTTTRQRPHGYCNRRRLILIVSTVTLLLLLSIINVAILGRQTTTDLASSSSSSSSTSSSSWSLLSPPALAVWKNQNLYHQQATKRKAMDHHHPRVYRIATSSSSFSLHHTDGSQSFLRSPQPLITKSARQRVSLLLPPPPLRLSPDDENDADNDFNNWNDKNVSTTQPPLRDPPAHEKNCIPLASWQTASYPTCNIMHDIDMKAHLLAQWQKPGGLVPSLASDVANNTIAIGNLTATELFSSTGWWPELHILAKGWFRTTWEWRNRYPDTTKNDNDIVVLKTLRMEREFLSEYYDLHNRDAMAMERLTFSPYVVNVYGYCGQSALNEYADFPHGQDVKTLEKLSRLMRGKRDARAMLLRLVMAAGLASGLAHVHRAGAEWQVDLIPQESLPPLPRQAIPALMVHYDINPRNIALFSAGRPKINDFNIAEFIRYDPVRKQPCGFESRMHGPWWRSPEEVRTTNDANSSIPILLNEKVDVYSLGSTLLHLFTSFAPRGKMILAREDMVRNQVIAGKAPVWLPEFANANDTVSIAFRHVIQNCHHAEPHKRWSAQQIANYFLQTLRDHKVTLMHAVEEQQRLEALQLQQQEHNPTTALGNGGGSKADTTSSLVVTSKTDSEQLEEEEEEEDAVYENKG